MRSLSLLGGSLLAVVVLLASACGGGDDDRASDVIPTATPFATVPQPTIVSAAGGTATATATPAAATTYTVVSGDVLSALAARFGVTTEELQRANNLTSPDLAIGQTLTIPRPSAASAATATPTPRATSAPTGGGVTGAATPTPSGLRTYTVQSGDTAYGIALQFDTTVAALERVNGVAAGGLTELRIGQSLRIPAPGDQ